eukprot:CAMPEP_0185281330 /NCGR_PEP_ID=MMETSP1359-20130426/66660_1 /TAXON_ID=552665 /ORGANISM="Bigelowiella longifila, Strain CCMP242" /LENGTH=311 /DNA_ID=CAMNT_0027876753 /DNA_START=458 /DNA_END=1393 /DNA_ORIENTATION=+
MEALKNTDYSHPALIEFYTSPRPMMHYWMDAIRVGKETQREELMREIVFKKRLGVTLMGNRVVHVKENRQAAKEGVKKGWRVHMVNGKLVPYDLDSLSREVGSGSKEGKQRRELNALIGDWIATSFRKAKSVRVTFLRPPPSPPHHDPKRKGEGKVLERCSDLSTDAPERRTRPTRSIPGLISSLPDLPSDYIVTRPRISSIAGVGASGVGTSRDNILLDVSTTALEGDDGNAVIRISPPPAEEDAMQRAFFPKGNEGKTGGISEAPMPQLFELSDGALSSMIDDDGFDGIAHGDPYDGASDLISPMARNT